MSDVLAHLDDRILLAIGLAAGVAVGVAVALLIVRRRERDADADDLAARRAEVEGYRATYADAVARARAAKSPLDQAEVDRVDQEFAGLVAALTPRTTGDERANLVARAEELERRRAYVYPEEEILLQARTSIADMVDWGVPRATIQAIRHDLVGALEKGTLVEKRAALNKVFDYYDSWSAHVEDYEEWSGTAARVLSLALVLAVVVALVCGLTWRPLFAFLAAGMAGALMSVLSRMPAMLGWKQWATYTPRILGRLASGLGGTLVGGALLVAGTVAIGGSDPSFAEIVGRAEPAGARDLLTLLGFGVVFGFTERILARINPFGETSTRDSKAKDEATAGP